MGNEEYPLGGQDVQVRLHLLKDALYTMMDHDPKTGVFGGMSISGGVSGGYQGPINFVPLPEITPEPGRLSPEDQEKMLNRILGSRTEKYKISKYQGSINPVPLPQITPDPALEASFRALSPEDQQKMLRGLLGLDSVEDRLSE